MRRIPRHAGASITAATLLACIAPAPPIALAASQADDVDAREPANGERVADDDDQAPNDEEKIEPLTIDAVIAGLRSSNRSRVPWAVRVRVVAAGEEGGGAETIELWLGDDGAAAIRLRPYIINIVDDRIVMTHELDAGSFAVVAHAADRPESPSDHDDADGEPDEVDDDAEPNASTNDTDSDDSTPNELRNHAVGLLRRALPPVYDLPLHLALSDDADLSHPLVFTPRVRWTSVESADRGRVRVRGEFAAGEVVLIASQQPWRVRSYEVRYAAGDRVLRFEQRPIASPSRLQRERWLLDLSTRRELASVRELRARPGDVTPGRRLPDLGLADARDLIGGEPAGLRDRLASDALLIFEVGFGEDQLETAIQLASEIGRRPLPVAVFPPDSETVLLEDADAAGDEAFELRLALLREAARSDRFAYSISPERTIDRFLAPGVEAGERGARAVLVTVDDAGRAAGVIVLSGADEPDDTLQLMQRAYRRAGLSGEEADERSRDGNASSERDIGANEGR